MYVGSCVCPSSPQSVCTYVLYAICLKAECHAPRWTSYSSVGSGSLRRAWPSRFSCPKDGGRYGTGFPEGEPACNRRSSLSLSLSSIFPLSLFARGLAMSPSLSFFDYSSPYLFARGLAMPERVGITASERPGEGGLTLACGTKQ